MLEAVIALITAVLNDTPQLWTAISNALNSHPSNPNQSVAAEVKAGTQAAEDALHNTVLK